MDITHKRVISASDILYYIEAYTATVVPVHDNAPTSPPSHVMTNARSAVERAPQPRPVGYAPGTR